MAESRQIVLKLFSVSQVAKLLHAIVIESFSGFLRLAAVRSHGYFTTFRADKQLEASVHAFYFMRFTRFGTFSLLHWLILVGIHQFIGLRDSDLAQRTLLGAGTHEKQTPLQAESNTVLDSWQTKALLSYVAHIVLIR